MIRAVALMLAAWLIPLAVVAQSAAPAPAKPALPTVEEPDVLAGQKARVEQERARVQARFAGEEKACRARFLVNVCLDEARERSNAELAELRRQDVILGDA
ncbi:MAG TPA: hypothetical protein VLJ86_24705, partial [Ramlibacter sp.]|nr:hypothetical protein [Ramlibacter sp.]